MKMSKSKSILFIISIFLTNIAVMGDFVITPIINNLYITFSENINLVNFMVSGPLLVLAIVSIVAGKLLAYISKKNMIIVGEIMFAASTIFGVAIETVAYMTVARCICGAGIAFINVAGVALLNEVYTDENKRAQLMGFYGAANSVAGIGLTVVAGLLAVSGWQNAFKTYWCAIPMLIMSLLFLPNIKPQKEERHGDAETDKVNSGMGKKFWVMIAELFVYNLCYSTVIIYFLSTYVAENNLGNEAFVGYANSLTTVGCFIISLIFGAMFIKLQRKTFIPALIGGIIPLAAMYLWPGKLSLMVCCAIVGAAYGIVYSFTYAYSPLVVSEEKVDKAIGIGTATYSIAGFLATYFGTFLMDVMKTDGKITPIIPTVVIIMILLTVFELIIEAKEKKQA